MEMKVTLYTDGAARGNPDGPGGYGAVLQYVDSKGVLHEREFCAGYKKTTNNRMELMAVIIGLEALTRPCEVVVVSDSKYVTDAFLVETDGRSNVKTPSGGYQTSERNVFVTGDMHRGQSLVVWAIREGREAARAVDESLMGYTNLPRQ